MARQAIAKSSRKRAKHRGPSHAEQQPPRFAQSEEKSDEAPTKHESIPAATVTQQTDTNDHSAVTLLPPALADLYNHYDFASMSVISSSKVETKVKTLLAHLARFSFSNIDAKPGVIVLHAKSSVANKMITVIEIAKRTVRFEKGRLYQYCRLGSELLQLKDTQKKRGEPAGLRRLRDHTGGTTDTGVHDKGPEEKQKDGHQDEAPASLTRARPNDMVEIAFETMPTPEFRQRPKVRAVPVLTVYLSRVPVKQLAAEYGYVNGDSLLNETH